LETRAKNQGAAIEALLGPLQRAVSCVSKAVIRRGAANADDPDFLTLGDRYVPLQGRYRLELSVLHTYVLKQRASELGAWQASTANYFYQVREWDGQEVIAFHWHPGRRGQPDFPHLHVTSQSGSVQIPAKSHVPTGRISIESVVRFLIEELDVRPLRPDWDRVLLEGERSFDDRRSW